jgi:hypothetical protein
MSRRTSLDEAFPTRRKINPSVNAGAALVKAKRLV